MFSTRRNILKRGRVPISRRRGQAVVEFALIAPLLIMLSLLLIQYGIIMNTMITLSHLSREGARYAAVNPVEDDVVRTRISQICPPQIRYADLTITVSPAEGNAQRVTGNPITVTISYNMNRKRFLPATFFGVRIFASTVSTQASVRIE